MFELAMGTGHVGRHASPGLVVVHGSQQHVAHRAARISPAGLQLELDQDLPDLLVEILAGNEQYPQPAAAGQGPVAGEEDSILSTGQPDQLMVVQLGIIDRIVTQNAQPLGECAKHGVGDK